MDQRTPDQTYQSKAPSSTVLGNSTKSLSAFNQQRDEISSCPQHQTDDGPLSTNNPSILETKQVTQILPDSQDHHIMTDTQQRKKCNEASYASPTYDVDDKVPVVHQLLASTVESKRPKPKSDRCNLRKGKWTVSKVILVLTFCLGTSINSIYPVLLFIFNSLCYVLLTIIIGWRGRIYIHGYQPFPKRSTYTSWRGYT